MTNSTMPQVRLGFKLCRSCHQEKPLKDFDFEPRVRSKTTARCTECIRAYRVVWNAANPERIKVSRKKYAEKYPERIAAARTFTERREALELREKRLLEGRRFEPVITDDGQRCPKCRRRKPINEFNSNGWCKPCAASDTRERLRSLTSDQREKRRLWFRKYDTERLYGVKFEELQGRLERQGGICKICKAPIDLLAKRSGCVDHCHSSLKIRGILCVKCNAGLGQFRDNPKFLASAIEYLRMTEEE